MHKGKLDILLVTDFFYPHWTGFAKFNYYLVQALKSYFDTTVLTVRHEKNLRKEEVIFSTRVIRENYLFSLSRSKYSIDLVFRFLRLIKNYDVIFINSPCVNILPLSLIAKLFRKKLLIFHHGDLILPKGIGNRIIEKIFDISSCIALSLSDKVGSLTFDYAKHSRVLKLYLSKFYPLLAPIYLQKEKHTNIEATKKIKHLKKQDKMLFGFAGRFVEEKGFDILFDAIPMVVQELPNAHFVFAGETRIPYENFYQKSLSKLKDVEKKVTFLGLLKDEDLIYFYKNISFIILPSRSDCFPLVQAEAVLSQTPSIVSDIPGARVIVKKTGFGIIFEKENPKDLAAKIIEATKRRKEYIRHYKSVLKLLNNKKNVEKIREFIEN